METILKKIRNDIIGIVVTACLILAQMPLLCLVHASPTIEISQWGVDLEVRTYEPMIMHIEVHNPDFVDHQYTLILSTIYASIFHGWGGYILTTEGTVKANDYAQVSIVLYPTTSPQGGSVRFQLNLLQDNPSPPPLILDADEETKWVTVTKGPLELDIDNLKYNYTSLSSNYTLLQEKYADLQDSYDSLESNVAELQGSGEELNQDLSSLAGEMSALRIITFVLAITTVALLLAAVIFATRRRPKMKSV